MATPRQPESVTLSDKQFKIYPTLTVWSQAAIQKSIGALFVGGAKGFEDFSDEKFVGILQKLLGTCVWMDEEGKSRPLQELDNVEACFQCDTATMYQLAFEVLRYNKFPFFEKLVAIGKEKLGTSGFAKPTSNETPTPKASETLES